ncbi:MAG: TonB-dependent receptor domain-containing protein, partial [Pyrinomonadaceae bacterium]
TQFSSANDPCDARFRTSGPNPSARAANCTAAGLPANFTSIIVNNSRPLTQSGNSALDNEKANSWTIGVILQPPSVRGLSLSVDWVNIKLANAIERLGVQTILETCYDATDYPSNPACGLFNRDSAGQITGARQTYVNAGSKQMRGLQVALNADFRLPSVLPGKFSARANYFYLNRLRTSIAGGAPVEQAGEIEFSKHRATVYTSYSDDNFLVGLTGNYIGSAKFSNSAASNTYDIPGVHGWFTLDAVLGFNVTERLSLRLIVDNLFDRSAPYPAGIDDIGLATYNQGIFGRRFTVSASTHF